MENETLNFPMESLKRVDDILTLDGYPLDQIAADFGTPTYVYSRQGIVDRWRTFDEAFGCQPHLVCYAVKANSCLAVLQALAEQGSGFDIVSGGELAKVLKITGGDASKVVFSGVGKTEAEMRYALSQNIKCFNVESEAELYRLETIAAEMFAVAPFALRVNPDVDCHSHEYISTGVKGNKFGISFETALRLYHYAHMSQNLRVIGIDCHIGSQMLDLNPLQEAIDRLLHFQKQLASDGICLSQIDIGGGLGINYQIGDNATPPIDYVTRLLTQINQPDMTLLIEPGRSIVGNNGLLITRVEYVKQEPRGKHFTVVDAAMNDLLRPALYGSWHTITEVHHRPHRETRITDVVGPICESADFLGLARPLSVQAGDHLAVLSTGAYGFAMSCNYNSRPRAAQVMVDKGQAKLISRRDTFEDLIRGECLL